MNDRKTIGGNYYQGRLWLVMVIMLLASVSVFAQSHVLEISSGKEVVDDRNKKYGSIHFTTTLIGGQKVDENTYSFKGMQAAELQLELRVQGNSKKWNRRMIVGISEKSFRMLGKSNWQSVTPQTILLSQEEGSKTLTFKVEDPGTYNIVLQYVFLDKDENDSIEPNNWPAPPSENIIITKQVTLINLPTAADREWEGLKKSGNAPKIIDFVLSSRGQNKLEEGAPIIEMIVAEEASRMLYQNPTTASINGFIAKYKRYENRGFAIINNRLDVAHKSFLREPILEQGPVDDDDGGGDKVIKPTLIELATADWITAISKQDTQLLIIYREQYTGVIPKNDEVIPDSLSCWSPSSAKLLKRNGNGPIQFQLKNFIAPAYYDIYEGRLTIDDDLLLKRKLLSIDVERSGKFNVLIVDKGCPRKQVPIPLDNLMSAAVTADTILGVYAFTFEGGTQPYALQLVPEDGIGKELLREKIPGGTFVLSVDSLQAAGLEGKYLASAYGGDSDSPVTVAGPTIDVPARPWPSWILPALIVVAIGVMALLLLFILRSGKPKQRTIFEEA